MKVADYQEESTNIKSTGSRKILAKYCPQCKILSIFYCTFLFTVTGVATMEVVYDAYDKRLLPKNAVFAVLGGVKSEPFTLIGNVLAGPVTQQTAATAVTTTDNYSTLVIDSTKVVYAISNNLFHKIFCCKS